MFNNLFNNLFSLICYFLKIRSDIRSNYKHHYFVNLEVLALKSHTTKPTIIKNIKAYAKHLIGSTSPGSPFVSVHENVTKDGAKQYNTNHDRSKMPVANNNPIISSL